MIAWQHGHTAAENINVQLGARRYLGSHLPPSRLSAPRLAQAFSRRSLGELENQSRRGRRLEQREEAEPEQRRKEEREEAEPEQRRKEARAEEASRVTGLSWGGRSPSSPRPGNGAARGPGGRRKQIRATKEQVEVPAGGGSRSGLGTPPPPLPSPPDLCTSAAAAGCLRLHLRLCRLISPPPQRRPTSAPPRVPPTP